MFQREISIGEECLVAHTPRGRPIELVPDSPDSMKVEEFLNCRHRQHRQVFGKDFQRSQRIFEEFFQVFRRQRHQESPPAKTVQRESLDWGE